MNINLGRKVVIITGTGKWICESIINDLYNSNATLVVLGRTKDRMEYLKKKYSGIYTYQVDFYNHEDILLVSKKIISEFPDIYSVIHAAAIYDKIEFSDISSKNWHHHFQVNINSICTLLQQLNSSLLLNKSGRIIFISSIAGTEIGVSKLIPYSATKGAINGFMKSLSIYYSKHQITVNSISPGNIHNKERFPISKDLEKEMCLDIPLGKLGKAEDISSMVVFLCSKFSGFITGQSFVIDGGQSIY